MGFGVVVLWEDDYKFLSKKFTLKIPPFVYQDPVPTWESLDDVYAVAANKNSFAGVRLHYGVSQESLHYSNVPVQEFVIKAFADGILNLDLPVEIRNALINEMQGVVLYGVECSPPGTAYSTSGVSQLPKSSSDDSEMMAQRYRLKEVFPALLQFAQCPVAKCDCPARPLWGLIQHINDRHQWTREAIADWLESLDLDLGVHNAQESQEWPEGV